MKLSFKRIMAVLLSVVMVIGMLPTIFAEEDAGENLVEAAEVLTGAGTENDPYMINTADDLILFRDSVNAGETVYNASGVYVALGADIDLEGIDWSVNIGDDCNNTFDGIFDGQYYTISNLTSIETARKADGYICTGLFGAIAGDAVVKNLTLENVTIDAKTFDGNNVGAVVGFAWKCEGAVENVKVTGDISISAENVTGVGAIVGYDYYGKLDVTDCEVIGDNAVIAGKAYVGGVIGYASSNSNVSDNTVKNAAISGTGSVGGVAGIMLGSGVASGNTVENVDMTVTGEMWNNSAAIVIGTISGGGVTVSETEYNDVTVNGEATDALVGGNLVEKPEKPIEKVQARIGDAYYATLQAAINAAKDGDEVDLILDLTQDDGVIITNKNITVDLNGNTYTVNSGANANNRAIKIDGTSVVTIKNGTIDAKGTITDGAYGTIRTEGSAEVILEGLELYSYRGYGLNVKACTGTKITMNDVEIYAQYSGGVEAAGGEIILNDVVIEQTGVYSTAAWCSVAIGVNGNGKVTVNSGTYSAATIAEDANAANGTWVAYVMSSGGTLEINGGTFNGAVAETAAAANACGVICADTAAVVCINGGTFNSNGAILDMRNNTGNLPNPSAVLSGGTFSADPRVSGLYSSNLITVAEGFAVIDNGDGTFSVKGFVGSGTAEDPYLIRSRNDLEFLRDAVNAGEPYEDKYFKQTADIDLEDIEWTPIGSAANDHGFMGNYDGAGKKILNLTITELTPDADGYVYAGLFGVTEGRDIDDQNTIENLTIENVTISSEGHIVAAAIAYPYYTIVKNITVCGDIAIEGGNYTAGVLAYTRRCVEASGLTIAGNEGSYITGTATVGGVISDIQMNGGLTANYSNFNASGLTISGTMHVGGISGIISQQTLNTCSVKNVVLNCTDARVGIVAGSLGDVSTISGITIENVTGAEAEVGATYKDGNPVQAKVCDTYYADLQTALDAAAASSGEVTVEILSDINLLGIDWNPVTVSAPHYPAITVNGNEKTITGLNDMLFAGTWAGSSALIINDLTIAGSVIENDVDDAKGNVGVGAFIGFPQASAVITLNNCHLRDSQVIGGHWTGGLIGYAAGYAGTDGPVFMNLTIKDCSVKTSIITGKGSCGGIIGHATGNGWTNVEIIDTTVSGNTVTSTGNSTNKAGAVIGTIGAAGQETTVNGVTHTGGVSVDAEVSGNDVTSADVEITTIYGRQGTETGMLYVTGGTYEYNPIEEGVSYAAPAEGVMIIENDDGTFGVIPEPTLNGSGTEEDPYQIGSVEDLILFRDKVNAGKAYTDAYVVLTADIDLSSVDNWTPIGDMTYAESGYAPVDADKVFSGVFDGDNHVISNLKMSRTLGGSDPANAQANLALFGVTGEGAVIKDLTITNVTIDTDGRNVAALVGHAHKTTLENITVNGNININGGHYVAGICGMARTILSASDLTVVGNDGSEIVGKNIVGGIFPEIAPYGRVEQYFADLHTENVAITGVSGVGGILGLLTNGSMSDVTVKDVVLTGKTEYQGDSKGRIRMGSVVGLMGDKGPAVISNITCENVTGWNLDGESIELPVIGANYSGSVGNETQAKVGDKYYAIFADAYAAAQAGDTITLLADITASDIIVIDKAVTLDGAGHTITGSARRVINVCELSDAEVTLVNLKLVSAAVRTGTNDIRGINLFGLNNVTVNIENCSVDFADASASDWAYAVNVCGDVSNSFVNVIGGSYEGANVINAHGTANTITVKNTVLTSLYPDNDVYYGACIWVAQLQGSSVVATGNTFNGNNAVAFNLGEGTALTESGNTDNTKLSSEEEPDLKEFYGTNVTMGNELDLNFAFFTSYVDADGYAEIVRTFADDRADEVTRIYLTDCEVRNGAYIIKYAGLAAKEMCDEVQITIYDADDKQISEVKKDCIRDYVMRMVEKDNLATGTATIEEVRALFVDMLNYGAAAQINFEYAIDNLANSGLNDEQRAYGTQTVPECDNNRMVTGDESAYSGTNFVLENRISMQMGIYTDKIAGGYAEVSFTDHYGKEIKVTIDAEECDVREAFTIFRIDEIVVADGRQDVTCVFYDAEGDVLVTVVDSLASYVARMGGNYSWLYEILKFSDSAYNYFH